MREQKRPERSPAAEELRGLAKIQHRFAKQYLDFPEERRKAVHAEAAVILQKSSFPLDAAAVLKQWERHTVAANKAYRESGHNSPAHELRHHALAAVYIGAVRAGGVIRTAQEALATRSELSAREKPSATDTATKDQRPAAAVGNDPRQRTSTEQLAQKALERLRNDMSAPSRAVILEGTVAAQLVTKQTRAEVLRDFGDKLKELRQQDTPRPGEVQVAYQLAVLACARTEDEYANEAKQFTGATRQALQVEVDVRLAQVAEGHAGVAELRNEFLRASVKDTIEPSSANAREAHVLAMAIRQQRDALLASRDDWHAHARALTEL